jgi:dTDP-4-amino-4,6-dideoxygalactose transaminase
MTIALTVPPYDMVRANARYRSAMAAVTEAVLATGHLILGERLQEFEKEFAAFCGTRYCVGTANGMDALTLALQAIGIGPGDEVIVPAFTFIATWFSVVHAGARPVPVDVPAAIRAATY